MFSFAIFLNQLLITGNLFECLLIICGALLFFMGTANRNHELHPFIVKWFYFSVYAFTLLVYVIITFDIRFLQQASLSLNLYVS